MWGLRFGVFDVRVGVWGLGFVVEGIGFRVYKFRTSWSSGGGGVGG